MIDGAQGGLFGLFAFPLNQVPPRGEILRSHSGAIHRCIGGGAGGLEILAGNLEDLLPGDISETVTAPRKEGEKIERNEAEHLGRIQIDLDGLTLASVPE